MKNAVTRLWRRIRQVLSPSRPVREGAQEPRWLGWDAWVDTPR
jgi:hypothetical protein